ncbi:MAG TPA: hypothetical protein VLB12_05740 [Gemmatimonadales bacterium]|nr:hypothetical protein [Gemmatimonadales bacterium]
MTSHRYLVACLLPIFALSAGCNAAGSLVGGGSKTTIAITNKISSLSAGQSYQFDIAEDHDGGAGFTTSLTGQGTLVETGLSATYIAPSVPPSPNSVTVKVTAANGSGVSDSDTFTITGASGPVVTISPATFNAQAGGPPVSLSISVTMDQPIDVLMVGTSGSPACGGPCGTFGPLMGTPGGGSYTIQYIPPASVTEVTQQTVNVLSNLQHATRGIAYVTISP